MFPRRLQALEQHEPWAGLEDPQVVSRVTRGERPAFERPLNDDLKALAARCWDPDPGRRPPFSEVATLLRGRVHGAGAGAAVAGKLGTAI